MKSIICLLITSILFKFSSAQVKPIQLTDGIKLIDTLFVISFMRSPKSIEKQTLKFIFNGQKVRVVYDDKYKVIIMPKESLDSGEATIANFLITEKDTIKIPDEYRRYMKIPFKDSLSLFRIEEYSKITLTNYISRIEAIKSIKDGEGKLIILSKKNKNATKFTNIEIMCGEKRYKYSIDNHIFLNTIFNSIGLKKIKLR